MIERERLDEARRLRDKLAERRAPFAKEEEASPATGRTIPNDTPPEPPPEPPRDPLTMTRDDIAKLDPDERVRVLQAQQHARREKQRLEHERNKPMNYHDVHWGSWAEADLPSGRRET